MKRWKLCVLVVTGTAVLPAFLAATGTCGEKGKTAVMEQKLPKNLPPAVLTAFQKAYPKATIKDVDKETDSTAVLYEIESVDSGVKRTVIYKADGTLNEVEEEISPAGLPKAVRQTIEKNYPKGKLEKVEKVTKGVVMTFEALIVTGETHTEVVFDSTGKVIKSEEIAADEDEQD